MLSKDYKKAGCIPIRNKWWKKKRLAPIHAENYSNSQGFLIGLNDMALTDEDTYSILVDVNVDP